jgi:EF hand
MPGAGPRGRALAASLAVLSLAACGLFGSEPTYVRRGPIYSPNGEPLSGGPLGAPGCAEAMGRWLARVDGGSGGTIGLDAFLADARRQFAAMDLDHTGVLTPDILARYRAPYLADEAHAETREPERRRRGADEHDITQDRADPVMLADVSLRNRVTRAEFLAYARRNFAALDRNKDGRLDRDELAAACAP